MLKPAAMAGGACMVLAGTLAAQGNSSLSDLDIEFTEAKMTLQTVAHENDMLRRNLTNAQASINSLTQSVAVANSEAEVFRREYTDLKLRMEALGIDAATEDKARLEQRLLKAVRDLQIVEAERRKLADQLVRLSEAVFRFIKTTPTTDADSRMDLEEQMRATSEELGVAPKALDAVAAPASLMDAMVVDIKDEISLVVANVGSRHGVKMGMPFEVWRAEERIGLVRVVNVREKIAGAVVQDLTSDKNRIRSGDRLKVDAQP
jgi:chromosome segregation ATPase